MCRYIRAEHILGSTFVHLIKSNKFLIPCVKLYEIERSVDQIARISNNAIVCMSSQELFATIDVYEDIFSIRDDSVELHLAYREQAQKSATDKDRVISLLQRYFEVGIPKDIRQTLDSVLNSAL